MFKVNITYNFIYQIFVQNDTGDALDFVWVPPSVLDSVEDFQDELAELSLDRCDFQKMLFLVENI